MSADEEIFFIGVDVGSGSVRAALVDGQGHIVRSSVKELKIWKPKPDVYQQSSNDIWECCIEVIKNVTGEFDANKIAGIGFDATCSLVALSKDGEPISVSECGDPEQNIVMWMDHRAHDEAEFINDTKHQVLQYVGGKVSLEMEMPKLLWLKNNFPERWQSYGYFFDLPDFLTWKATGSFSRSLCSLVCKWNFECTSESSMGWNLDYLNRIGLSDLAKINYEIIGNCVLMPGEKCGSGLTAEIARVLGLKQGTAVATSIIDAHAGGLGMIGTQAAGISPEMSSRLSLICGTSTCHMAVSREPVSVPGVWGPYFSAMVPLMWLNEAGQSASGLLLDYVISSHPVGVELLKTADAGEIRSKLRATLANMASGRGLPDVSLLTRELHMWPDYHGNRSPLADPAMRGMLAGLSIDCGLDNLALMYLATLQALAYGTRHIIETLVEANYEEFKSLLMCGGITKDPMFVQIQADAAGLPVLLPREKDSVLVGSAILGACASGRFKNVQEALSVMGGKADVVKPNLEMKKKYHDYKYKVYLKMCRDQLEYRSFMDLSKQ